MLLRHYSKASLLAVLLPIVASVVFLLLPNSASLLYLHNDNDSNDLHQVSCISRAEWAWLLITSGWLLLLTMFLPACPPHNTHNSIIIPPLPPLLLFVLVNLLWFLAALMNSNVLLLLVLDKDDTVKQTLLHLTSLVGGKAAWPAMWNLAIVGFPVHRTTSLFCHLHGTQRLHKWAGQAMVFWLSIHALLLTIVYAIQCDSLREFGSVMLPYKNWYTEGMVNFVGWIGFIALVGLWILSLPMVREWSFELFYASHGALAFLMVLGSNLHDYNTMFFVMPGLIAWLYDRIMRRSNDYRTTCRQQEHLQQRDDYLEINPSSTMLVTTLDDCNLVGLTFPSDLSKNHQSCLSSSSSMVYLRDSSISSWQSHPFSVAFHDTETRSMTIFVKALGDWSTRFVHNIKSATINNDDAIVSVDDERVNMSNIGLLLEMEGPYCATSLPLRQTLDNTDHIVFVAGGVGLTGVSHQALVRHNHDKPVTLIWLVQTQSEATIIMQTILCQFQKSPSSWTSTTTTTTTTTGGAESIVRTRVKVFITQPLHHNDDSPSMMMPSSSPTVRSKTLQVVYQHGFIGSHQCTEVSCMCIVIACVLVSFVVARLISCHYSVTIHKDADNDDESPIRVHYCSFLHKNSTVACQMCDPYSNDDNQDAMNDGVEMPCCTVGACMFAFRGLPVILAFTIPPALLICLLCMIHYWIRQRLPLWTMLSPSTLHFNNDGLFLESECNNHSSVADDQAVNDGEPPVVFQIEYGKPCLDNVLMNALTTPSNGESQGIVVCGPCALEKDVRACTSLTFPHVPLHAIGWGQQ